MSPPSTLEVNLAAVRHNLRRLNQLCLDHRTTSNTPFRGACAAIKADAYGMGAVRVARALRDIATRFAVYTPAAVLQQLGSASSVRLAGLMTHFSSANDDDATTRLQHDRFRAAVAAHRSLIPADCTLHVANTFGVLRSPQYHEMMIRPGIGLLGY